MENKCYCGSCLECRQKCQKCFSIINEHEQCQICISNPKCECGNDRYFHAQLCDTCDIFYKINVKDSDTMNTYINLMKNTLQQVFNRAEIDQHYINILLAHENEYKTAFTAKSMDANNNYEMYECIGDPIASAATAKYFYLRFPQLNCPGGVKVMARLKNNKVSKTSFSEIAESLGFWPLVRNDIEKSTKDKNSLLEDVFEAFIFVTCQILDDEFQVGVGFHVIYYLIKYIYDNQQISLEYNDLYDTKSRLKELFDLYPQLGRVEYVNEPYSTSIYVNVNDNRQLLAKGGNKSKKADREQDAARIALDILEKRGYVKQNNKLFCE